MTCFYINPLNNDESNLHKKLLNILNNVDKAEQAYNIINTEGFIEDFGDWTKHENDISDDRLDEYGQPQLFFDDYVSLYYFRGKEDKKIYIDSPPLSEIGGYELTAQDRKDLVFSTIYEIFQDRLDSDMELDSVISKQDITNTSIANDILLNNEQDVNELYNQVRNELARRKITVSEDNIDEEEIETKGDLGIADSNTINPRDNATANIKMLFAFIPKYEWKESVDGTVTLELYENFLGLPQFEEFTELWNDIQGELSDIITVMENNTVEDTFDVMLRKLEQMSSYNPAIAYLLNEGVLQNLSDWKKTQFVQAFSNQTIRYYVTDVTQSPNGDLEYLFFDGANTTNRASKIRDEFTNNLSRTNLIKDNSVNKQELLSIKEKLTQLEKLNNKLGASQGEYDSFRKQFIDLSKKVGLSVTNKGFDQVLKSNKGTSTKAKRANLIDQFNYLIKTLGKSDVQLTDRNGNFTGKDFKGENIVRTISEAEAKFRRDLNENTTLGPDGKIYWRFSKPSYLASKLDRLKNSKQERDEFSSEYYQFSIWKDFIADESNHDRVHIATLNSIQKKGDEAKDNKTVTKTDQLADSINKTLNGIYYTPAPADKGKYLSFVGMPFFESNVTFNKTTQTFRIGNEEVLDTFVNYFENEFDRIRKAYADLEAIEAGNKKAKMYYHTNGGRLRDKNGNPVGNAFKIMMMPELSNLESIEQLRETYPELLDLNIYAIVDDPDNNIKRGQPISALTEIDRLALREYINNRLSEIINDNRVHAFNNGVISYNPNTHTNENVAIDTKLFNKYKAQMNGSDGGAIDRIIADYTINGMIANIEYTKLFSGDPAYYKDPVDYFKRIPATYTDGLNLRIKDKSEMYFNAVAIPSIVRDSQYLDRIKKQIGSKADLYKNVDENDAQGYITLDRWKFLMEGVGKWNPNYEQAYQRLLNGTFTADDYKYAAQPLKGVYFDVIDGEPVYLKYSQAVLIPSMVTGTGLGRLLNNMVKHNIQEAVAVSGIKAGATLNIQDGVINNSNILDENGNFKEDMSFNPMRLKNQSWKLQQDLAPKSIKPTDIGSQMQKNLLANFREDYLFTLDDGTRMNPSEIISEINNLQNKLSDEGLKVFKNEFGIDDNGRITNYDKLNSMLLDEAIRRNAPDNDILALSKRINIDYLPNYRHNIQTSIMAALRNRAVKIQSMGGSFIQMSNYGFHNLSEESKNNIKWLTDDTNLKPALVRLDSDGNEVLTEDGRKIVDPGQILIPHNLIVKYIPNYQEMSMEQLKGMIPKEMLKLVGYRIPNQSYSSNDSLEIVGILPPEIGDTIVAYSEITKKTGSDFDIDKMYFMIPNIEAEYQNNHDLTLDLVNRFTREELLAKLTENNIVSDSYIQSLTATKNNYNLAREIVLQGKYTGEIQPKVKKLNYIKYQDNTDGVKNIQNRLIELYRSILESPDLYDQVMNPLDDPYLRNDIIFLHGVDESSSKSLNMYNPSLQMDIKFDNIVGKNGVALTANQMVDHPLGQMAKLYIDDDLGIGRVENGITRLDGEFDTNNNRRITEVMSLFLTAYVDIAKDPYISRGNYNDYTSNTVMMLIRAGVPLEWVNRFIGQPILKDLSREISLQGSLFGEKNFTDAITKVRNKYPVEESVRDFEEIISDGAIESDYNIVNLEKSLLRAKEGKKPSSNKAQQEILNLFLKYKQYGDRLSESVLSSKADTNGGGKNLLEAFSSRERIDKVIDDGIIGNFNNKFVSSDTENGMTSLGTKTMNSVDFALNIANNMFFTTNENSRDMYKNMFNILGKGDYATNSDLLFQMEKEFYAYVIAQHGSFDVSQSRNKFNEMFLGDNTMYDRIMSAKVRNLTKDNFLIQSLQPRLGATVKTVGITDLGSKSTEANNELYRAWLELHNNDKTNQLSKDLIKYSFYTSAFKKNMNSFFDNIPHEILTEAIQQAVENFKDNNRGTSYATNEFLEQFIKHNYDNTAIVPRIGIKKTQKLFRKEKFKVGNKTYANGMLVLKGDNDEAAKFISGIDEYGRSIVPPYITSPIKIGRRNVDRLYEMIGYQYSEKYGENPVYLMVNTLGINENGQRVYEYGRGIKDSMFDKNNTSIPYYDLIKQLHDNFDNNIELSYNESNIVQRVLPNVNESEANFRRGLNDGNITSNDDPNNCS